MKKKCTTKKTHEISASAMRIAFGGLTIALLSGCTSTSVIDTAVYANSPADTFGAKFSDDTEFKAEKGRSASLALNYDNNTVSKTGEHDFSLKKNDTGGIDVTIEGRSFSFSAEDQEDEYGFRQREEKDGITIYDNSIFSKTGTIEQALGEGQEGRRYHRAIGYQLYDGSEPNLRGIAVIGAETPQSSIDDLASSAAPTASYSGSFSVDSYPTTGPDSRTTVRGDFNMNADFGAGTISGASTFVEARGPEDNDFSENDTQFGFSETNITGNEYSGAVTADGDTIGNYSGGFYGPSAEEIAGVISTEVTDEDGTSIGIGHFSGAKED